MRQGWELRKIGLTCGRRVFGRLRGCYKGSAEDQVFHVCCAKDKCDTDEWLPIGWCINNCQKNVACDEAYIPYIMCWRRSKAKDEGVAKS